MLTQLLLDTWKINNLKSMVINEILLDFKWIKYNLNK